MPQRIAGLPSPAGQAYSRAGPTSVTSEESDWPRVGRWNSPAPKVGEGVVWRNGKIYITDRLKNGNSVDIGLEVRASEALRCLILRVTERGSLECNSFEVVPCVRLALTMRPQSSPMNSGRADSGSATILWNRCPLGDYSISVAPPGTGQRGGGDLHSEGPEKKTGETWIRSTLSQGKLGPLHSATLP